MPDGRFLSKTIAHDLELNTVSFEADYLFTRCVPHLDREGRMPGHPSQVKGMACPMRSEMSLESVDRALRELAEAELVEWYQVDGKPYLAFPGFASNQKGLRKDREAESRVPSPNVRDAKTIRSALSAAPESSDVENSLKNDDDEPDDDGPGSGSTPKDVATEGESESLRSSSGPTPELVGSTPDLVRPREVKLSQVKRSTTPHSYLPAPPTSSDGQVGEDAHARTRRSQHPALPDLWADLEPVILDRWHRGEPELSVAGRTPVGMPLERLKVDDLLQATDDPEFVRWAVYHGLRVLEFTEPATLFLLERNLEQVRGAYLKTEPTAPLIRGLVHLRSLSGPDDQARRPA